MTFAEKLKSIRKKAGLSQEQLAEKLGVSRQAVTKWETETGIPDIENMMAISALFDISIDELLSNERGMKKSDEYLFESVTEYDIDEPKRYDMKFGGAKQFVLSGYEGEKIRVRLVSNTLSTLQNDFKVKIDDIRKRIDVDVIRKNGISEATAKETVNIFVQIPMPYVLGSAFDMVGSLTAPISMLVIGFYVSRMKIKEACSQWRVFVFGFIRFFLGSLALFYLLSFFISDELVVAIAVLEFAMPTGAMVPAFVASHKGDALLASEHTVISAVLSFVYLPLIITIMTLLPLA